MVAGLQPGQEHRPEDEYDFEGKDVGKLLPLDPNTEPINYMEALRKAGFTPDNPPTLEQTLQILANERPKVQERDPSDFTDIDPVDAFMPDPSLAPSTVTVDDIRKELGLSGDQQPTIEQYLDAVSRLSEKGDTNK